eukprot:7567800-Alexandrium_andersonii.AAC.1
MSEEKKTILIVEVAVTDSYDVNMVHNRKTGKYDALYRLMCKPSGYNDYKVYMDAVVISLTDVAMPMSSIISLEMLAAMADELKTFNDLVKITDTYHAVRSTVRDRKDAEDFALREEMMKDSTTALFGLPQDQRQGDLAVRAHVGQEDPGGDYVVHHGEGRRRGRDLVG